MQDPSQRRPACQYSKGQAPLCQSPATAGSHTHLAVIMTPPVPPVLNNLAGVSQASAPTCRVRPPSVCQHSAHIHCLSLFVLCCFFFLHPLIGPPQLWCLHDEGAETRSSSLAGSGRMLGVAAPERWGEPVFCFVCQLRPAEICNYKWDYDARLHKL